MKTVFYFVAVPIFVDGDVSVVGSKALLRDIEKALIKRALVVSEYCHAQAAKKLKMNRTTLVEKMKRYDLMTWREHSEDTLSRARHEQLRKAGL
jgi:transcriptional regulator of acetoin/glycerol metabolism